MVTPELVRPIPKGMARPDLTRPGEFLPPNTASTAPQTPGMDVTGPVPPKAPPEPSMPVEDLIKMQATTSAAAGAPPSQQLQFVPAVLAPQPGQAPPQAPTPSVAPPAASPAK